MKKSREGVVACVFDGTDRLQHMFFRYLDDQHPANLCLPKTLSAAEILTFLVRCGINLGGAAKVAYRAICETVGGEESGF